MQVVEVSDQTEYMDQSSVQDHDVHNLMATSKDVKGSRKVALRELSKVSHALSKLRCWTHSQGVSHGSSRVEGH